MTKQLNRNQANAIAIAAAKDACGFTRVEPDQKFTLTGADIIRVLESSAFIALMKAGCLDQSDAIDQQIAFKAADRAHAEHQRWCRATGNKF